MEGFTYFEIELRSFQMKRFSRNFNLVFVLQKLRGMQTMARYCFKCFFLGGDVINYVYDVICHKIMKPFR